MNFFSHQDKARSQTKYLVALFALAIFALIVITEIFLLVSYSIFNEIPMPDLLEPETFHEVWGLEPIIITALIIISVVFLAFVYKKAQLSAGGPAIAEAMQARKIQRDTLDADERKILNVVEEMAIASGTPVPPVYLIEDLSINAFAAGYTPKDAVIGITRGAIRILDRDELQGVIAHEFSHIFNGDMRMNIRLISMLHGIMVIGLIGYWIMRASSESRYHRSSYSRDNDGAGGLIFFGIGLMIIGYTGTFFGNLIKSAVSRQREFLADASAVQYTRNPQGIAGALQKIGGYPVGSYMEEAEAEEISHMFFSQGVSSWVTGFFSTHPPLQKRIKRIQPRWNGKYPTVDLPEEIKIDPSILEPNKAGTGLQMSKEAVAAAVVGGAVAAASTAASAATSAAATAIENVGDPSDDHVEEARRIIGEIPEKLKQTANEAFGARAIVYCLLLDPHKDNIGQKQMQQLQMHADPAVYKCTQDINATVATLDPTLRLALLDLCMPSLKDLTKNQLEVFNKNLLALIKADYVIELREWSLYRIIKQHLSPPKPVTKMVEPGRVKADCLRLLSALALSSADTEEEAHELFQKGWSTLELGIGNLATDALEDMAALDKALQRANHIKPLKKPMLIKALCKSLKDAKDPESLEMIRAICDGLDTPIPPLLKDQLLV